MWFLKLIGLVEENKQQQEQQQEQQQGQPQQQSSQGYNMGGIGMGGFDMSKIQDALANGNFDELMNQGINSLEKMGASPKMINASRDFAANVSSFMKGEMTAKEFMKSDATKNFIKEGKQFAKEQGIPGPFAAIGGKVAEHYLGKQMKTMEQLRDGKISSKEAIAKSAAPFKKYASMAGVGKEFDAAVKQAQQYAPVVDAAVKGFKQSGQGQSASQASTPQPPANSRQSKNSTTQGLPSLKGPATTPQTKGGMDSLGKASSNTTKATQATSITNTSQNSVKNRGVGART